MPKSRVAAKSARVLLEHRGDASPEGVRAGIALEPWGVPDTAFLGQEGNLIWRWGDAVRQVTSSQGLLLDFLRLGNSDDEAIVRFTKRWGAIELCCLGMPTGHFQHVAGFSHGKGSRGWCELPQLPEGEEAGLSGCAPCIAIKRYAQQAYTLIAAHNRTMGWPAAELPSHYSLLSEWIGHVSGSASAASYVPPRPAPIFKPTREWTQDLIAADVELWIQLGKVAPRAVVAKSGIVPKLSAKGPFGAIAAELFLSVTTLGGLAFCSGHRQFVEPDITPRVGDRFYCAVCRASGRAALDAKSRYRRKPPGPKETAS